TIAAVRMTTPLARHPWCIEHVLEFTPGDSCASIRHRGAKGAAPSVVRLDIFIPERRMPAVKPIFVLLLSLAGSCAVAAELPIFDAHVHYSHDAWANLPPQDAIAILRRAGIVRALVSSSGDEGTQRLVAEAP